jgi:hypothetical protein
MLAKPVRFARIYPWYLLVAIADIVITWIILTQGGRELNIIAAWAWNGWGPVGLSVLKFTTVALVVIICELIAELSESAGRRLATWAVILSMTPIVFVALQIGGLVILA